MLRLLTIITLSSVLLFANTTEKKIENFFLTSLEKYKITEFKINKVKPLEYPKGWSAYFISLKYNVQDRDILLNDVVFSDDLSISRDFTYIDDRKSLKKELLEEFENDTNLTKEGK
jgi:hypothetical protein